LRVFISHSFNDPSLAATLVALLKEEDIIGYMAQRVKEYKLLIIDKIKKEISESDYLVAIITNAGIFSPSVNEEIGYAIGRDVPVIIMMEEGIHKTGVLTHGREPEIFKIDMFSEACLNVRQYLLQQKGIRRRSSKSENKPILVLDSGRGGQQKSVIGINLPDELTFSGTIKNTGSTDARNILFHAKEVSSDDLGLLIKEKSEILSNPKSLGSLVPGGSTKFFTKTGWKHDRPTALIAIWLQYTFLENEKEEALLVVEVGPLLTLENMNQKRYTDHDIREAEQKQK
jgi:TIR domain